MTGYMRGQYAKSLRRRIVYYNGRRYTITKNRHDDYVLMVKGPLGSVLVMQNI